MRRELVRQAVAASLMESKVIVSPSCNSTQGTWHEGMQANGSRNLTSITLAALPIHSYSLCAYVCRVGRDLGRCTHILTHVYCIYVHTNKLARMCCMRDDHQLQATFDNIQTQHAIILHYTAFGAVQDGVVENKDMQALHGMHVSQGNLYYESLPETGHPLMRVVQTHTEPLPNANT